MEHYYFIEKNGTKLGPYKLNELKQQTIYFDELIWRSDSDLWKKASDFEELNGIYIVKPPPTPKEQKIAKVNREFTSRDIKMLFIIYILTSLFLGLISTEIAKSSWVGRKNNRYPYSFPGRDTEKMYSNNEQFLFRPFKAFGSTIYLTEDERWDSSVLLRNLTLSSFASLSFIFFGIGIVYYAIKRNGSVTINEKIESTK